MLNKPDEGICDHEHQEKWLASCLKNAWAVAEKTNFHPKKPDITHIVHSLRLFGLVKY